jgi:hypothetical protein
MKEAPLSPMERALLDQVQESLEKMDLMRREMHELREALRDERRARVKLERWTCNGCVPVFCEHYSP